MHPTYKSNLVHILVLYVASNQRKKIAFTDIDMLDDNFYTMYVFVYVREVAVENVTFEKTKAAKREV